MPELQKIKKGLGRGLDTLLPPLEESGLESSQSHTSFREVEIGKIVPGRLQPRTVFDEDEIEDLSSSVAEHGILEPLVVSPLGDDRYELIAGERRFRAAQKIGLTHVPAVIKNVDSESMLLISLVENIQREDLSAIEEARAYKTLVDQFLYTQEQVAKKVGRSRSTVANALRLLELPNEIQDDILMGRYSAGHARAILAISSHEEREKLRQKLLAGISVREAEEEARKRQGRSESKRKVFDLDPLTDTLRKALGTKVIIRRNAKGRGKITIEFYSDEDLGRLTKIFTGRGNNNEEF